MVSMAKALGYKTTAIETFVFFSHQSPPPPESPPQLPLSLLYELPLS